jgi:two-component system NtrC family sensor kinase
MVARWNHRRLRADREQRRDVLAGLGMLAAGLSHEINSPISFVHSNLELLAERIGPLLELVRAGEELERQAAADDRYPEARHRFVTARLRGPSDEALDDLPNLASESLDGTKLVLEIASALKAIAPTDRTMQGPSDLAECCERALLVVRHEVKYRAQVTIELEPTPPVAANPAEVCQILINLLVNAAQAIEKRGSIVVRLARDGAMARLEVEDDGCGIPSERIERIFEPFYTTKKAGRGTGLGLMLVADLVHKHGGTIDVDSDPGRGSRFTVLLPLAEDRGTR